jgi:hypothetical protein
VGGAHITVTDGNSVEVVDGCVVVSCTDFPLATSGALADPQLAYKIRPQDDLDIGEAKSARHSRAPVAGRKDLEQL